MTKNSIKKRLLRLYTATFSNKKHRYPIILGVFFLVLVCFQLSGTSVGIYHEKLYGETVKDHQLLYSHPESVRSDEWLVATQLTVAQKEAGFPMINPYFNGGKDMSVITDVPYLDWSILFKPQNLIFFILPIGFAFAFKWWLLLFLLLVSSYYFILRLLPDKRWIAIGGSIVIGCSPFVFWWYQTITIAPLFYGFFILLIGMSIIDGSKMQLFGKQVSKNIRDGIRALVLSYLLISFALVLYPPFQIPVGICVGFFLIGYLLNSKKSLKSFVRPALIFLSSIILTAGICAAFVYTRHDTITTISSTAYPGKRSIPSGGFSPLRSFTSYLQPNLQRSVNGNQYILNQSESADFILLPFFFIPPLVAALVWLGLKKRKTDWVLWALLASSGILLAHLFILEASPLTALFLLDLVPQSRLLIGLGFLAILILGYLIRFVKIYAMPMSKKYIAAAIIYTLGFLTISILAGIKTSLDYPGFISNKFFVVALAILLVGSLGCFLVKKYTIGIVGLVLLSLASTFHIHPLYRGVGVLTNDNEIIQTIKQISSKDDVWATDSSYFENFPQLAARQSVTGVAFYPNNNFWKQYAAPTDKGIYNRYAHIYLSFDAGPQLNLLAMDTFTVSGHCDQPIVKSINYVLSTNKIMDTCYTLVKTLQYPKTTIYFYKVSTTS